MVESLSEAVMVNEVPLMSKQKQSRMGKVFFCTMTRPMVIRRDERVELEITNFMRTVLDGFVLIVVLPRCFLSDSGFLCLCKQFILLGWKLRLDICRANLRKNGMWEKFNA